MQTSEQMRSYITNIKYYIQEINKSAKVQFESDYQRAQQLGINAGPGSIRFDCLGCIGAACVQIDVLCDNILANIKSAEEQDKILHIEEIDEQD